MDGLLNILGQFFQLVINGLIGIFNTFMHLVENMLPASPFAGISDYIIDIPWLGVVNYFVPLQACVDILVLWAGGMVVFFVVSIILRWLKVVS